MNEERKDENVAEIQKEQIAVTEEHVKRSEREVLPGDSEKVDAKSVEMPSSTAVPETEVQHSTETTEPHLTTTPAPAPLDHVTEGRDRHGEGYCEKGEQCIGKLAFHSFFRKSFLFCFK